MASPKLSPRPFFDTLENLVEQYRACVATSPQSVITAWLTHCCVESDILMPDFAVRDYQQVLNFLYSYRGSMDTFNAYRRELERLIQWCWFIQYKSLLEMKRADVEAFIEFSQKPPTTWIGTKTVAKFIDFQGLRQVNLEWRPFIVKVSKKSFQEGARAKRRDYQLSSEGIRQIFAILSSFYNYLLQEEQIEYNPILQIRQKSKFIRKNQTLPTVRRLSVLQWEAVIQTATDLADRNPLLHERTLFIIQTLYSMYLRISELSASTRWVPLMSHFFRDANGDWWFKTVGKGNKMRQIAVSPGMLQALKRWRNYLQLPPFPSPDEHIPLIPKNRGKGPISSTRALRIIVQICFDQAITKLRREGKAEEADILLSVTVHWLRHTGISDDVKIRPREHVRDDAGHSSSAITDRYIDVELKERADTAKKKGMAKPTSTIREVPTT
ncbi:MAG: site-specific integrase [Gammaproteobacteria bacterium]|nr:site-specific integrase [Gammaproteobacteria bacterium]